MSKADECDKDVALVLGLDQGVVAERARGLSTRTQAKALACVVVLAGVLAIGQRPAGDFADRLSVVAPRDAAQVENRADMLLAAPGDSVLRDNRTDAHKELTVANQDDLRGKPEKRTHRSEIGLKRSVLSSRLISIRSRALARKLNMDPGVSVLQLPSHYEAARDYRLNDVRSQKAQMASGLLGEKSERTLQSERLEAIDAIRLLRQR